MKIFLRRIIYILIGSLLFINANFSQVYSWDFEKNTISNDQLYDLSKNVTGKLYGSTQVQDAKFGDFALSFDGKNDFAKIDTIKLNFSRGFGLSCWLKPQELQGKYSKFAVFKENSFYLESTTNWSNISVFTIFINKKPYSVYSKTSLNLFEWNHIAVSYSNDSKKLKLFLNNELHDSLSILEETDLNVESNSNPLFFGKNNLYSFYSGLIDNIEIFEEEISRKKINDLYNNSEKRKIAHWNFDDSKNFFKNLVDSDYDIINHGIKPGFNPLTQSQAAQFGNDSYFEINSEEFRHLNEEFTLACWVKPKSYGADKENYVILNKGGFILETTASWNKKAKFALTIQDKIYELFTTNDVDTSNWYHLAVSFSNETGRLTLYYNGDYSSSLQNENLKNVKINIDSIMTIGKTSLYGYYDGQLDELMFYNFALNSTDIKKLYIDQLDSSLNNPPESIKNIESGYENNSVFINWTEAIDDIQVSHYEIFRNDDSIGISYIGSFVDYNIEANKNYIYKIRSVDLMGLCSDFVCDTISTVFDPNISITSHPKMFFDFSQIQQLRERSTSSHVEIYSPIKKYVDELIVKFKNGIQPTNFDKYFSDNNGNFLQWPGMQRFYDAAGCSYASAFIYIITGESKYAELAKTYLLWYLTWPNWGDERQWGSRDLGLSTMIISSSITYDWIYSFLSKSEREKIRNRIIFETEKLYEASTVYNNITDSLWQNWWYKAYAQNHWTTNNSALGVSALALSSESPHSQKWLEKAHEVLSLDSEIIEGISDGTWHEGIFYQNCKISMVLPFYFNYKKIEGVDFTSSKYYENYVNWMVYNYLPDPNTAVLRYSSFRTSWGGLNAGNGQAVVSYLANQYNNGYAQWLYKRMLPSENRNIHNAYDYVYEYFYYNDNVSETSPHQLDTDLELNDLEGVIWRTGWSENDITFGFKTGAIGGKHLDSLVYNKEYFNGTTFSINPGHSHGDANSFYLYHGGTDLSTELNAKFTSPDTNKYASAQQSSVHNTILVNGIGQYVNPWDNSINKDHGPLQGKLEKVITTSNYNYLCAEASNRYRIVKPKTEHYHPGENLLNKFKRHILFDKTGYIFIIDDIVGNGARTYDWICHFFEEDSTHNPILFSADSTIISSRSKDGKYLTVKSLTNGNIKCAEGKNLLPFQQKETGKKYLKITSTKKFEYFKFINILIPNKSPQQIPEFNLNSSDKNLITISSDINNQKIYLINLSDNEAASDSANVLQGKFAIVEKDQENIKKVFLSECNELVYKGISLFSSKTKFDQLEVSFEKESVQIFSEIIGDFRIYAPQNQSTRVFMNNKEIEVNVDGNYIIFGSNNLSKQTSQISDPSVPEHYAIYQNYPNPFNPSTSIKFDTPEECKIKITIYDLLGREISTIVNDFYLPGRYTVDWDGSNSSGNPVASGIYFYRIISDKFVDTRKMLLIK